MSLAKFAYDLGVELSKMEKEAAGIRLRPRRVSPVAKELALRRQKQQVTKGPVAGSWGDIGRQTANKLKGNPLGLAAGTAAATYGLTRLFGGGDKSPAASTGSAIGAGAGLNKAHGVGGWNEADLDPASHDPLYNYMTRAGIRSRNLQNTVDFMNAMQGGGV